MRILSLLTLSFSQKKVIIYSDHWKSKLQNICLKDNFQIVCLWEQKVESIDRQSKVGFRGLCCSFVRQPNGKTLGLVHILIFFFNPKFLYRTPNQEKNLRIQKKNNVISFKNNLLFHQHSKVFFITSCPYIHEGLQMEKKIPQNFK